MSRHIWSLSASMDSKRSWSRSQASNVSSIGQPYSRDSSWKPVQSRMWASTESRLAPKVGFVPTLIAAGYVDPSGSAARPA